MVSHIPLNCNLIIPTFGLKMISVQTRFKLKPMFQQTAAVNEICQPLFSKTGVSLFSFLKIFSDGAYIELESSKNNFSIILNSPFPEIWPQYLFEQNKELGITLSDLKKEQFFHPILKKHNQYLKKDHFLQFLNTDETSKTTEFYSFAADENKNNINEYYLNNIEVFKNFNEHFNQQMQSFIETVDKVPVKKEICQAYIEQVEKALEKQKLQKQKTATIHADFTKKMKITKRQKQIGTLYLKNQNIEMIAKALNLSFRTVQRHLENLQTNLLCHNKSQLVEKFKTYLL